MDFVPKSTRARWKSLDSISVFGWCGSAALGGALADAKDYSFTFLITAAVQGCAVLLQATLMFIVPRQENKRDEADDDAQDPVLQPLPAATPAEPVNPAPETSIQ